MFVFILFFKIYFNLSLLSLHYLKKNLDVFVYNESTSAKQGFIWLPEKLVLSEYDYRYCVTNFTKIYYSDIL